jgi:hypothetical protein
MTLCIMKLSKMTLNKMTLSIMAFNIMTLNIMTLSIVDTQPSNTIKSVIMLNAIYAELSYMLSATNKLFMLSVVMLNVVAPLLLYNTRVPCPHKMNLHPSLIFSGQGLAQTFRAGYK